MQNRKVPINIVWKYRFRGGAVASLVGSGGGGGVVCGGCLPFCVLWCVVWSSFRVWVERWVVMNDMVVVVN